MDLIETEARVGSKEDVSRRYMPDLDGLRAIAVLLVLFAHFCPLSVLVADFGRFGVDLFFVLSGFLITGILLNGRARGSPRGTIRNFYARRFLRILPLYYVTLLVFWVAGLPQLRQTWPWHAAYLSNVFFALHVRHWGEISHLWSLSVEEQFYLVWPLAILLAPRRLLLPAMIGVVAASYLYRFCASTFSGSLLPWGVALASFDQLAAGAILAYCLRASWWPSESAARRIFYAGIVLGGALMLIPGGHDAAHSICFAGLIGTASLGIQGPARWFFRAAPVSFTGRISYGIYMLHNFQPYVWHHVCKLFRIHVTTPNRSWPLLGVVVVLTFASATASWFLLERPLLALKRRFPD